MLAVMAVPSSGSTASLVLYYELISKYERWLSWRSRECQYIWKTPRMRSIQPPKGAHMALTAEDKLAIHDVLARYGQAYANHEAEPFAALYTEDALLEIGWSDVVSS